MISSRPSHSATMMNTGKTSIQNERIMKPQVVLDYNKGRQDIDLSDQLSAYYICIRRSIKWYRMVIFGTAIVSSYLIYRENYAASDVTILEFRESLVRSLLLGMPSEKLKPGPRQKSTRQTSRSQAQRKRRICSRCPKTLCWLLRENQSTTIERSRSCSCKESKNFLS